jgi:hypothetical protein
MPKPRRLRELTTAYDYFLLLLLLKDVKQMNALADAFNAHQVDHNVVALWAAARRA